MFGDFVRGLVHLAGRRRGEKAVFALGSFCGSPRPGFVCLYMCIWVVPKIRGTYLGVPITRIIVFWGLYWGPFRETTI